MPQLSLPVNKGDVVVIVVLNPNACHVCITPEYETAADSMGLLKPSPSSFLLITAHLKIKKKKKNTALIPRQEAFTVTTT